MRSENIAVSRNSDGGKIRVWRIVVGGAGELLAWERVEARAEWGLTDVAGGPVVDMRFRFK